MRALSLLAMIVMLSSALGAEGQVPEAEVALAAITTEDLPVLTKWCRAHAKAINAPVTAGGNTLLGLAVLESRSRAVQLLIKEGADVNGETSGATPLHVAASSAPMLMEPLLAAGAKINAVDRAGYTPLSIAISSRREASARMLLTRGADPNAGPSQSSLLWAIEFSPALVPLLVERGARLDARDGNGRTALHIAAGMAEVENASLLLDRGVEVDARDHLGLTALHVLASPQAASVGFLAFQKDGIRFARLLLAKGAKVSAQDNAGETALHLCARLGLNALVRLLIDANAKIDLRDKDGRTPMQLAAQHGQLDTVNALLSAGASTRTKDHDGATPLHLAAGGMPVWKDYFPPRNAGYEGWNTTPSHLEIIEALLRAGADRTETDAKGRTAAKLARDRGFKQVADRLEATH